MKRHYLSDETWRDIPQYEGIYQASTHGRIRSVDGKTTHSSLHGTRKWKSRVLKGRGDNRRMGKRVSLWKNGKQKDFLVARLVAETFLGEPPEGFTVNHKDGNRLNNHIDNLEWLSLGDNIRHGFETGLYRNQKSLKVRGCLGVFEFRSMAQCDKFLSRSNGYTSNSLNKGRKIKDKDGNIYEVTV